MHLIYVLPYCLDILCTEGNQERISFEHCGGQLRIPRVPSFQC